MVFTTWVPVLQTGPFAATVTDTHFLRVGNNKVPCVIPLVSLDCAELFIADVNRCPSTKRGAPHNRCFLFKLDDNLRRD